MFSKMYVVLYSDHPKYLEVNVKGLKEGRKEGRRELELDTFQSNVKHLCEAL